MNQNIIFGLLIVFLILIIILLILLLIFPKETKSLGIGLGICSIITIIIGGLYTKNIDNNSCACGKGECKKCGGINRDLILPNTKQLIKQLINILSIQNRDNNELKQIYAQLGWTNECQDPFLQQPSNEFMTKILYLEDYADLKPTNISLNIKLSKPTVDKYMSKLSNDPNPELNIIQNYSNYVTDTSNDTTYQTNIPNKINYNYFTLNIGIEEDLIRFINNDNKLKKLLNMFLDDDTDKTLNDIGEVLVNTKFLEDNSEFFRLKQGMTYYDDNSKPFISKFINIIKRNIIKQILDNSMILNLMKLIRRNINNDYFFLYITPIIAHRPSKTDLYNYLDTIYKVFPEFNQFELLGITNHEGNLGDPNLQNSGGHYTSIVIRINDDNNKKVIWICDDISGNKIVTNITLSDKNINMVNSNEITHFNTLLFKKTTKNYIKGEPIRLYNDRNSCYVASALQLLLATDLLDDEEVKSEEVKSEEENVNNIIEEARKNLPELQKLQTEIENLSNSIYSNFKKIPDDYGFLEKNIIWHIKGYITNKLSNINSQINDDIKFINNIINNPDFKKSSYFYTDFIPKLDKMNIDYDKIINEINKNIELINQQHNNLKILNDLTSNFIEFEKEYNNNKKNFSNVEIEKKIIQIKDNIQNTFIEFKAKIQIKENIEEVKKYKFIIEQIKEDIKLVKAQITELSTKKLIPSHSPANINQNICNFIEGLLNKLSKTTYKNKNEKNKDIFNMYLKIKSKDINTKDCKFIKDNLTEINNLIEFYNRNVDPRLILNKISINIDGTINIISTPTPAPKPVPGSPAPKPTPATTPATPIPAPSTTPIPMPSPALVSTMSGKTTSSLPVYEFSTGEIEEAWEKELSTSKPKKVENTNTEFDKYLNKLLKENV